MSEASITLQQQAARQVISEAVRELTLVSDEARFQIHLFSLEAKRRWNEIESKLRHLEHRIAEGTDETAATKELSRAIRELLAQEREGAGSTPPVRSLMSEAVQVCQADQSLSDAAAVMSNANCKAVAVANESGVLVGVLGEREICMGAFASGATLSETPIAGAMRREVERLRPDESLASATEKMRRDKLEYAPVVDGAERVIGMLWLRDLARRVEDNAEGEPGVDPAWLAATVVDVYAR